MTSNEEIAEIIETEEIINVEVENIQPVEPGSDEEDDCDGYCKSYLKFF